MLTEVRWLKLEKRVTNQNDICRLRRHADGSKFENGVLSVAKTTMFTVEDEVSNSSVLVCEMVLYSMLQNVEDYIISEIWLESSYQKKYSISIYNLAVHFLHFVIYIYFP